MVRGLDEDESSFLDEVSRQQIMVEKQRRDEEKQELLEYRISFRNSFIISHHLELQMRSALVKKASAESRREPEKSSSKPSGEQKTSHLSQAHLLVGAVKRRNSSRSSESSKKQKVEKSSSSTGNGDRHTEQEGGAGGEVGAPEDHRAVPGLAAKTPSVPLSSAQGVLHLPSAAVCVGVLPGLSAYSGSSDSDSSSDSEGSVDIIMLPYPRHSRAYR
uniref:Family with sequence similarity 192, member A n=1 Tax=Nothobranchius korthausae TaxID=1143690 RepID=A0A1A8F7E3_9TELE